MEIKADKEGKEAIRMLCDVGLKVGGLQNLQGVLQVLNCIKEEEPKVVETDG